MDTSLTATIVYVIRADEKRHKIGITGDLAQRLSALSTASGCDLTAVATFPSVAAREVEKIAHWLLRDVRLRGEWFAVTAEAAITAVESALKLAAAGFSPPKGGVDQPLQKVATSQTVMKAPARHLHRLSARRVLFEKKPGLYADGGNLYLRVDSSGAKRWTFIFRWNGRRREMGLGPLSVVGLAEARETARIARNQVHNGIDPIAERRAA